MTAFLPTTSDTLHSMQALATATPNSERPIRLAHLSDIHLTIRSRWRLRDRFSKRLMGWLNLRFLGRARRFRHAPEVLRILTAELADRSIDHVIFSGDSGTLGFENEFARAAAVLGVASRPGLAVPGNHDAYVPSAVIAEHFETHFGPWQVGRRVEGALYPFVQEVGAIRLIGLNSARANRWTWDATGRVGREQLLRLRTLCEGLPTGVRILVTHYPYCLADGRPEPPWHRLRDADDVLRTAQECGISLWCHGHKHGGYIVVPSERIPFPIICTGSSTQTNLWAYNEYTITGTRLDLVRRRFDPQQRCFHDVQSETLTLPIGTGASVASR